MKVPKVNTFAFPFPCRNDTANTGGRVYGVDVWLTRKFLEAIGEPALRVVLWDKEEIVPPNSTPAVGMSDPKPGHTVAAPDQSPTPLR